MSAAGCHDRPYLQSRIHEESARYARHGHPFALLVFEAVATNDGVPVRRKLDWLEEVLRAHVRPSDVIARAFDDTIVALLVQTGADGARDALFRLRRLIAESGTGASWRPAMYAYPADAALINTSPMYRSVTRPTRASRSSRPPHPRA